MYCFMKWSFTVFKLINKGKTLLKNNLETILSNAISGEVHLTLQILQRI